MTDATTALIPTDLVVYSWGERAVWAPEDRADLARALYDAADDSGTVQGADLEALDHSAWLATGGGAVSLVRALLWLGCELRAQDGSVLPSHRG